MPASDVASESAGDDAGPAVYVHPQYILGAERVREIETVVGAFRWALAGPIVASLLILSGCAEQASAPPTETPVPTAAPTDTPSVGFAVVVTQVPTARATWTPVPIPTAFKVPNGPYVQLIPSSGPPVSRRIAVRGGHLPPSVAVQLGWSLNGRSAPISTAAGTDRHGALATQFSVPASPPGKYYVLLSVNGVPISSAPYTVVSSAVLRAQAAGTPQGDRIKVTGANFLPYLKLLLVAYPIDVRGKPVVLGTVRCGRRGGFRYHRLFTTLALGQYALRAWSDDAMSAEMAETFFQVVI